VALGLGLLGLMALYQRRHAAAAQQRAAARPLQRLQQQQGGRQVARGGTLNPLRRQVKGVGGALPAPPAGPPPKHALQSFKAYNHAAVARAREKL
jgi:hypothetical protein